MKWMTVCISFEKALKQLDFSFEPPYNRLHVDLDPQDIFNYITLPSHDKTNDRKYQVISGHFIPDTLFFPKATSGHIFSLSG